MAMSEPLPLFSVVCSAVAGVTGTGYDQCPVNADRALMTVTHVTDFLHNGSDPVRAVAFNPEKDNEVVSASDDCTLKVWSLADGQCKETLRGHE